MESGGGPAPPVPPVPIAFVYPGKPPTSQVINEKYANRSFYSLLIL